MAATSLSGMETEPVEEFTGEELFRHADPVLFLVRPIINPKSFLHEDATSDQILKVFGAYGFIVYIFVVIKGRAKLRDYVVFAITDSTGNVVDYHHNQLVSWEAFWEFHHLEFKSPAKRVDISSRYIPHVKKYHNLGDMMKGYRKYITSTRMKFGRVYFMTLWKSQNYLPQFKTFLKIGFGQKPMQRFDIEHYGFFYTGLVLFQDLFNEEWKDYSDRYIARMPYIQKHYHGRYGQDDKTYYLNVFGQ